MAGVTPGAPALAPSLHERARRIRLAVFDVDGVLTDGTLYLAASGEEMKGFHVRDGHGMKMLQASGVVIAILTGRRSHCVELRARELGIEHLEQGVADKAAGLGSLLDRLGVDRSATAYMGDDVIDLPAMLQCGLKATVPEAPEIVRRHADFVSTAAGGRGAAREFCELIMQAQGTLLPALERYLG